MRAQRPGPTRITAVDLLLLSNSTNHGSSMFSHAADAFVEVAAEEAPWPA